MELIVFALPIAVFFAICLYGNLDIRGTHGHVSNTTAHHSR